jgi:hypothetical protein
LPNPLPCLTLLLIASLACAEETIDFNRDIRPLLSTNCVHCHGPDEEERKAELRLDTHDGATHLNDGVAALVPGKPADSEMIFRVLSEDEDKQMPPPGKGRRFTPDEVALLRKWIEQGGHYAQHWAYEKPLRPAVPEVKSKLAVRNPIDAFVAQAHTTQKMLPSPEADRWALARRAAVDLTGLPPTQAEAKAFVNDTEAEAFERYVDRLLAKPAFGERWARIWLDLARYADSAGYADDPPRTIWSYRDWVIKALNTNMPFDQFTIAQIAGDLLEDPTQEQLVATAFHRNTLTNNEGGTNNEEFRNAAIVDRVNTTMEVWMGTTMACAQCHTHKFDPITHAEYFQLFDFFNQSEDSDQKDERPTIKLWSAEQEARKSEIEARTQVLRHEMAADSAELHAARKAWLESLRRQPQWTPVALKQAKGGALSEKDGWISLAGNRAKQATYTLGFPTEEGELSGLRLEVSPQQETNFVLSQLTANWLPEGNQGLAGRFVRLELPGKEKMIHLAEIQVFSGGANVALQAKASQSSTDYKGPAKLAIDGNTSGVYTKKTVTHTKKSRNPWIEIDLGSEKLIDRVVLWNRTEGREGRLAGYHVTVLDSKRSLLWEEAPKDVPKPSKAFVLSGARNLDFGLAVADFAQAKFSAKDVLSKKLDAGKGWAIGGATGKSHALTLMLTQPATLGKGSLVVTLTQRSRWEQHLLTDFRIAPTTDPAASEWAAMPAAIRRLVSSDGNDPKVAAYFRSIAPTYAPQRKELAKLEKELAGMKPATSVPVMRDRTQQRVTNIQIRGNYKAKGGAVKMGTPAALHPLRKDLPKNRLALAHWLVDPENPLMARVMVNRF